MRLALAEFRNEALRKNEFGALWTHGGAADQELWY